MKKAFIRQVIRGSVGLAVSIGIFITFYSLLDLSSGGNKLLRYLFVLLITLIFFGSLLYIFGGRASLIWGSIFGFAYVIYVITMNEQPWIITIGVTVFLAWSYIQEYLIENKVPSVKKNIKLEEQNVIEKIEAMVDKEFKDSIGFGKKSLLVLAPKGAIYQVITGDDKYYFIRIGGELSGIEADFIITDFSDERRYLSKKNDYVINKKDIKSVLIKNLSNYIMPQSGELVILMKSGKRKYIILDSVDINSMKKIFGDIKSKGFERETEPELSENDKVILPNLKKICLVLNVIAVIAPAIFLFMDFNYKLMSFICILIPLVVLGLYFKYNNILSLEDEESIKVKRKNKIMIEMSLIFPICALLLRSFLDFNLVELNTFILWSITIFSIFVIAFFLFTKEYKTKKSVIFMIILFVLLYVPSAIVQVNYLFDQSEPNFYVTEIIKMNIDTGSRKMPDKYLLTVDLQSRKEIEINVSRSFYEKMQKGQQVVVVERIGFLQIKYADIIE